ncbi:MAG: dephospho-CoA kinase [Deltaproteobacteria bacterium]|nr:dephospho-CoA kinase [Deltaproteobacteria bacterium]
MIGQPLYILGLTGGIACGKSTVAAWLVARGAANLDADQLARDVVAPGTSGLAAVLAEFGAHLRQPDGTLDRKALGALVFADRPALRRLEAIVHPRIRAALDQRLAQHRQQGTGLAVINAALLFDMGLQAQCHATLTIEAQTATQLQRLHQRDGLSPEAGQLRIDAQMTSEQRRERATWAIDNDGGLADLERALWAWWPKLQAAQQRQASEPTRG